MAFKDARKLLSVEFGQRIILAAKFVLDKVYDFGLLAFLFLLGEKVQLDFVGLLLELGESSFHICFGHLTERSSPSKFVIFHIEHAVT